MVREFLKPCNKDSVTAARVSSDASGYTYHKVKHCSPFSKVIPLVNVTLAIPSMIWRKRSELWDRAYASHCEPGSASSGCKSIISCFHVSMDDDSWHGSHFPWRWYLTLTRDVADPYK